MPTQALTHPAPANGTFLDTSGRTRTGVLTDRGNFELTATFRTRQCPASAQRTGAQGGNHDATDGAFHEARALGLTAGGGSDGDVVRGGDISTRGRGVGGDHPGHAPHRQPGELHSERRERRGRLDLADRQPSHHRWHVHQVANCHPERRRGLHPKRVWRRSTPRPVSSTQRLRQTSTGTSTR